MTDTPRDRCPNCDREFGPYRVLVGWHPCLCGGHRTRYCREDTGGCGHESYDPPLDERTCRTVRQGFTG